MKQVKKEIGAKDVKNIHGHLSILPRFTLILVVWAKNRG
jgi:hypothetical protein